MTMPGHPTRSLFLVTALLVPACAGNPTPQAPVAAAERSEPQPVAVAIEAPAAAQPICHIDNLRAVISNRRCPDGASSPARLTTATRTVSPTS